MNIDSAVIIMNAYEELDDRIKQFSKSLVDVIIKPRIDLKVDMLPSIEIQGVGDPILRS
jgi:hypothetical protein